MKMKTSIIVAMCLSLALASCCKKGHIRSKDCVCPQIYAPVCGTDGKVYGNYCEAKCAGVDTIACVQIN